MNPELIQGLGFGEEALSRGDLTEAEWRALKVLLPVEREAGSRGRPPEDNRNVINDILWRLSIGAPWRDAPEKYGNWNSIYRRLRPWRASGIWKSVAVTLAEMMAGSGRYSIDFTFTVWSLNRLPHQTSLLGSSSKIDNKYQNSFQRKISEWGGQNASSR